MDTEEWPGREDGTDHGWEAWAMTGEVPEHGWWDNWGKN